MNNVDERIVNLQFNNKDFEKNAQQSMKTLDSLKEKLSFKGVKDGFSNVSRAAKEAKSYVQSLVSPVKAVGDAFDSLLKTLGKFGKSLFAPIDLIKNALSGLTKGFSDVGKAVNLDDATKKISAFEQAAIGAFRRIGEQAVDMGERLVKSLTIDQVSAGWEKFGEKTKSVASILSAVGEKEGLDIDQITEKLEKLNWYTDETSYAYTDMTNNIAKFTNAGIGLDDAITAMIGIGNATGDAGESVQSASHAMEGFAKAMAAGYMSRQNWSWIETSRIDTLRFRQALIDAGVEAGNLVDLGGGVYSAFGFTDDDSIVTAETIANALTKQKWMTKEVMTSALKLYGGTTERIYDYVKAQQELTGETPYTSDAIVECGIAADDFGLKAFKASQEARTFADALDSVKDAISTGLMTAFEHLIGNYEEAKELWTDLANILWDIFAEPISNLNDALDAWDELGGHDLFRSSLYNFMGTTAEYIARFKEGITDVFGELDGARLKRITDRIFNMSEAFATTVENGKLDFLVDIWKGLLSVGKAIGDVIIGVKGAFESLFEDSPITEVVDEIEEVVEVSKEAKEEIERAFQAVSDIWNKGSLGNGQARVKALKALGLDPKYVQKYVNKIAYGQVSSLDEIHELMLKDTSATVEEVTDEIEDLEEKTTSVAKVVERVTSPIVTVINNIAQGIKSILTYANEDNQLVRIFKGVFSIANLVGIAIDQIAKETADGSALRNIVHFFVDPFARIADVITNFAESNQVWKIRDIVVQLSTIFKAVAQNVRMFGTYFSIAFQNVFGGVSAVDLIRDGLVKIKGILSNIFASLSQNSRLTRIFTGLLSAVKLLSKFYKTLFKIITKAADNALPDFAEILAIIADVITNLANTDIIEKFGDIIGAAFAIIISAGGKVIKVLSAIIGWLSKAITWIWNFWKELFSRLKDSDNFEKLGKSIQGFAESIKKLFDGKNDATDQVRGLAESGEEAKDSFSWLDAVAGIIDGIAGALSGFVDGLTFAIDKVGEFISVITGKTSNTKAIVDDGEKGSIFDVVTTRLGTLFDNVDGENVKKGARSYSGNVFSGIFNGIVDGIKNVEIDWKKLKGISYFIGLIITLFQINKILSSADKFMTNLKKIPLGIGEFIASFTGITTSFKNILLDLDKTLKENITLKRITTLVESIVALALTMALLSTIPEKDLYKAAKYLTLTLVLVVVFLAFLKKLDIVGGTYQKINDQSSKTIKGLEMLNGNTITLSSGMLGVAATIIGVAILIATVVDSLKKVEDIKPENLINAGITIGSILLGIIVFVAILAKITKSFTEVTSKTKSFGENAKTTVLHKNSGYFTGMVITILGIAFAIKMIAETVKSLGSMPKTSLDKGLDALLAIVGAMGGLVVVMGLMMVFLQMADGQEQKIGRNLVLFASAIAIIVGAIWAMVPAIFVLGALPADKVWQGIIAVGLIMTGLMVFAAVLTLANKYINPGRVLAAAASLVIVALAINMLVVPIAALAAVTHFLKSGSIWTAFGVLSLTLAAMAIVMAGMVAVLNRSPEVMTGELLEIAAAFVVLSVAVLIISAALSLLAVSGAGWKEFGILAIMTGIFAALGALTQIPSFDASKVSDMADAMMQMSIAVLIMAAAVSLIGYVTSKIGKENMNSALEVFKGIAVIIGIFTGILAALAALAFYFAGGTLGMEALAAIFQGFGEILKGFGLILIGIAASFVGFGLALLLVGAALPLIANGLPGVVDALGGLIDLMENHKLVFLIIALGFTALVIAIGILIASLIANAGPINELMTKIFESFMAFIGHFSGEFKKLPAKTQRNIKMIAIAVVAGLAAATPEMLDAIGDTILKVLLFLADIIPFVVDALLKILLRTIEGLADAIRDNSAEIVYAIADVLEALAEVVIDAVYAVVTAAGGIQKIIEDLLIDAGLNEKLAYYVSNVFTGGAGIIKDGMDAGVKDTKQYMRDGLNSIADAYGLDVRRAGEEIEETNDETGSSIGNSIKNLFSGFTGGDGISMPQIDIGSLLGGNIDLSSGTGDLANMFKLPDDTFDLQGVNAFFGGINSGLIDTSALAPEAMANIDDFGAQFGYSVDGMTDDVNAFSYDTEALFGDMLENTAASSEDAAEAVDNSLNETIKNVNSKKLSFREAGINLIKGLEDGIDYQWNFAEGNILSKFNKIIHGAETAWKIESPSKVFYQIGAYAMMGLANGGDDYGETAVTAFNNTIQSISDAINMEGDYTPTIRPVVDLSNARAGANEISGLYANQTARLAAMNGQLNTEARFFMDQNRTYNDANVVEEIKGLRGDIDSLNNNMANTNIYMDTGALVGATVGPMDSALGRRAQRTKRGG